MSRRGTIKPRGWLAGAAPRAVGLILALAPAATTIRAQDATIQPAPVSGEIRPAPEIAYPPAGPGAPLNPAGAPNGVPASGGFAVVPATPAPMPAPGPGLPATVVVAPGAVPADEAAPGMPGLAPEVQVVRFQGPPGLAVEVLAPRPRRCRSATARGSSRSGSCAESAIGCESATFPNDRAPSFFR